MVRKRRTPLPGEGQSSAPQRPGVERGAVGQPRPEVPQQSQQVPEQHVGGGRGGGGGGGRIGFQGVNQGEYQSGNRGGYTGGRGGRGPPPRGGMTAQPPHPQQHYGPPRGGMAAQPPQPLQHYGPPRGGMAAQPPHHQQQQQQPGYQERDRGPQQYPRGGATPQPLGGDFRGPYVGPSRPSFSDLHQAMPLPSTSDVPSVTPAESIGEDSSSQASQLISTNVTQQLSGFRLDHQSTPGQAVIPASSKDVRFPRRPGIGILGTPCFVRANHFFAELPDKDLHHYDVSISPGDKPRGVNRALIKTLVQLYKESHLGKRLPVYDGRKSLYTAGPLPFVTKDFKITLPDEEDSNQGAGDNAGARRKTEFTVVIKLAARTDLHHLGMFLNGHQTDAPQEALQVLDIVLREWPTSRYSPIGRSFYSPELGSRQPLGDGLECWRGFYQSIRPTQMGLSLNIDMSSTAFIEPRLVIDFVCQLLKRDVRLRPLSDAEHVKIKKALRGIKVEVTHRVDMRRKYRITGLTTQATLDLTFPVDNVGTLKSVVEYFNDTYKFVIVNTRLPCLQVGNPKRLSYLPMEACKIVQGQRYSKRLSEKQINELLKVTCQRPQHRENDIFSTVKRNAYATDEYAVEFGIKINPNLAEVNARVLPPPRLKYHDSGREKYCLPQVGQWNMMNKKMVNGGAVNKWCCVNFARNVSDIAFNGFCQQLVEMCRNSGMTFSHDPVLKPIRAHPDQVESALKRTFHDAMALLPKKELDLLIVVLPDNNGSLYGDLKRICETELGIVSQCCLAKHVFKKSMQYLANVSLKINVKVGGRNTVLVKALSRGIENVSDVPTIIFGADVTHPHPGEDSSPSIAAVVASQDWPEVTKYAGLVSAQAHRQELIEDLFKSYQDPAKGVVTGGMIKDLLMSFYRATGHKPQRIIFYRDGVSEGQFYQVLLYELDAIRRACASLGQTYQPRVTFVVVQKRHHTRLFASNHDDDSTIDKSGNILPGTVVDSKICHPKDFDFYLCSHAGIKGTSRPAHYHVLWDENGFDADKLQGLTNDLCYTYARCTRSVSIVPPAYYAHLAAFRARFYMEPRKTSDGGSVAAGGRGGGNVKALPALRENVKRVMFYC